MKMNKTDKNRDYDSSTGKGILDLQTANRIYNRIQEEFYSGLREVCYGPLIQ